MCIIVNLIAKTFKEYKCNESYIFRDQKLVHTIIDNYTILSFVKQFTTLNLNYTVSTSTSNMIIHVLHVTYFRYKISN